MIDFQNPFAGNYAITTPFGARLPAKYGGGIHDAIDYATLKRTPIESSAPGIIDAIYYNQGGGNTVEVRHGGGFETSYSHLDSIIAKVGQVVSGDSVIAFSGDTGQFIDGDHLHFKATKDSKSIDPVALIRDDNITGPEFGFIPGTIIPFPENIDIPIVSDIAEIPGAINDAAITFGFIFLGAMVLIAGVLIMRAK